MTSELNNPGTFGFLQQFFPWKGATQEERRSIPRYPFAESQRIAPFIGGRIPEQKDFQPICCKDVSNEGFSFLLPSPPEYNEWILVLDTGTLSYWLKAKVIHWEEVQEGNKPAVRVGCKFVEELETSK